MPALLAVKARKQEHQYKRTRRFRKLGRQHTSSYFHGQPFRPFLYTDRPDKIFFSRRSLPKVQIEQKGVRALGKPQKCSSDLAPLKPKPKALNSSRREDIQHLFPADLPRWTARKAHEIGELKGPNFKLRPNLSYHNMGI